MALLDQEEMKIVSREVHWYIETEPTSELCYNRIVSYLDAFNSSVFGKHTIDTYIDEMVSEILNPSFSIAYQDVKNYLKLIQMTQGSSDIGTGGLIINITSQGIKYVQLSDLMDLRLSHKEFLHKIEKEFDSIMKLEKNSLVRHRESNLRQSKSLSL